MMEDSSYLSCFREEQPGYYTNSHTFKSQGNTQVELEDEAEERYEFQWHEAKKSSTYYWSDLENKKYIRFLKEQGHLLLLPPSQRKAKKVNLLMSRKIKSRNSTQCHTHHQKMIGKHKTIEGIIEYYESLFEAKKRNLNGPPNDKKEHQQIIIIIDDTTNTPPQAEKPVLEPELRLDPLPMQMEYTVEGDLFEEYFEFQENILMEWLDW